MERVYSVKECRTIETCMDISQSICTVLIAVLIFYMIGIAGMLEHDAITVGASLIHIAACGLIGALVTGLKKAARYVQVTFARRRIFLVNGWF